MNFSYNIKEFEKRFFNDFQSLRNEISAQSNKKKNYVGIVDVTKILKSFKHLTIDENFRLMAYGYSYFLDTLGEVVAVKVDKPIQEIYLDSFMDFSEKIYAEGNFPPLEVLFCDGTVDGYFEVILFAETIKRLFSGYSSDFLNDYIFSCDNIRENPNPFIIKPNDWNPKFYINYFTSKTLLIYEHDYLNGIALCEYNFFDGNRLSGNMANSLFASHIDFSNERFDDIKHCCLFSRKQIDIRNGNSALDYIV